MGGEERIMAPQNLRKQMLQLWIKCREPGICRKSIPAHKSLSSSGKKKNGSTSKLSVSLTHLPNWPVWLETLSARHTFNLDCSQNEGSLLASWIMGGRQSCFREESPWGFATAQGSQGEEESEQKSAGDSAITGLWNAQFHTLSGADWRQLWFKRNQGDVNSPGIKWQLSGSVGIVGEVKTNLKSGSKI